MQKRRYMRWREGSISVTALVFMAVFLMILSGMLAVIDEQRKVAAAKEQSSRAFEIAEAGLDYYRWFLAHFPNDLQNGTGAPGPYVHTYADPESGAIGQFSLSLSGNYTCGSVSKITITSTGSVSDNPALQKTVVGEYGRPSVGEYSYILNSDVWAGSDRIIYGPFHSNGGIRMDGTNLAQVTSAKTTWNCTSSFGCNPSWSTAPGVFGSGPNANLWSWPVTIVDFNSVTLNLADMKNKTASTTPGTCTSGQIWGCYFPPSGGSNKGYHAKFLGDGRVALYRVSAVQNVWSYNVASGWSNEPLLISSETPVAGSPFTVPSACPIIFVEDRLWMDGVVKGKVSIAAANLGATDPDLILNGNIDYTTLDGSDGLLAIGENRVLVSLDVPNDMIARGIFIAQKGYFGRDCFRQTPTGQGCSASSPCNTNSNNYCRVPTATPPAFSNCGSSYQNCVKRNSMMIYGSVISNGRVGTKWICGSSYCSGFNTRTDNYDKKLADDPPPLTPFISDQYKFLQWWQTQ